MLLRNFDNVVNGYISGAPSVIPTENDWLKGIPWLVKINSGAVYCVTNASNIMSGFFGGSYDNATSLTNFSSGPKLMLGSNDADENYNDYKLELITSLSVSSSRGVANSTENGVHRCVLTKTFVNNTAEDVTVKEMGMYNDLSGRGGSSSSTYSLTALVAREKLAEPVTIPANGGVATFTMTITIPVVDNSAS